MVELDAANALDEGWEHFASCLVCDGAKDLEGRELSADVSPDRLIKSHRNGIADVNSSVLTTQNHVHEIHIALVCQPELENIVQWVPTN
ncbi:hypothetical protein TNCT_305851 [Trichonephila clavata]|uniref:Uncharacterized protein n=1 Tax=Trichonephila clavata TaxID=2740835 RepID=A0A8X6KKP5_TRICU|nr:hypothetical protein TNCT_305851 [Trichonephila clavata]